MAAVTRSDAVTRQDALKILSSSDPKVIRKTVEFWASSIDCFLTDYRNCALDVNHNPEEFKALMASRIVTIAAEMLMFFGVLDADPKTEIARLATTESIQAMVDRQVKLLVNECEKTLS